MGGRSFVILCGAFIDTLVDSLFKWSSQKRKIMKQSMSQICPSTRLEATKAPRWRIWVLDLKDICPWVNIWKLASKVQGLKSWLKIRFWTWNYAIDNKKACKYHLKTCILLILQSIDFKENSRSWKRASWLKTIRY